MVFDPDRPERESKPKAKAKSVAQAQPNLFGLPAPEPKLLAEDEARVDGSMEDGGGSVSSEGAKSAVGGTPSPEVARETRRIEPPTGASVPVGTDMYTLFKLIDTRLEKVQFAISTGLAEVARAIRESRAPSPEETLQSFKAAFLFSTGQEIDEILQAATGKAKLTPQDLDELLPTPQYVPPKAPATSTPARQEAQGASPKCPKCGKAMRLRNGKRGQFWGCMTYPGCNGTLDASDAKPAPPDDTSEDGCVDF